MYKDRDVLLLATQSGEMDINPIAFAIPIFLVAIVIEALIARARRKRDGVTEAYNFGTAMSMKVEARNSSKVRPEGSSR